MPQGDQDRAEPTTREPQGRATPSAHQQVQPQRNRDDAVAGHAYAESETINPILVSNLSANRLMPLRSDSRMRVRRPPDATGSTLLPIRTTASTTSPPLLPFLQ